MSRILLIVYTNASQSFYKYPTKEVTNLTLMVMGQYIVLYPFDDVFIMEEDSL